MEFSNRGKEVIEKLNKVSSWTINGIARGSQNVIDNKIGAGLGDKESRQLGQKRATETQRESGQLDNWRMSGTNSAGIKKIARNNKVKMNVYNNLNDSPFTIKEVEHIFKHHGMSLKMARAFFNNTEYFTCLGFNGHKTKLYKKIETKFK